MNLQSLYVGQGKRYSLANSRIMIHQPLGGAQGQAADIEIQANEILHHKLTLNGYLAEFTGQGMERITQDTGQSTALPARCALRLQPHWPVACCCLRLQFHWLTAQGTVGIRKYALCSYAFVTISCLLLLNMWGNTWSGDAGQDAHDVLTKACNDVLTMIYCSRPVSINDCKPWSRCHERAVRVLPYVLSCNSSQACFSRHGGRPRYKERVVVSSF